MSPLRMNINSKKIYQHLAYVLLFQIFRIHFLLGCPAVPGSNELAYCSWTDSHLVDICSRTLYFFLPVDWQLQFLYSATLRSIKNKTKTLNLGFIAESFLIISGHIWGRPYLAWGLHQWQARLTSGLVSTVNQASLSQFHSFTVSGNQWLSMTYFIKSELLCQAL